MRLRVFCLAAEEDSHATGLAARVGLREQSLGFADLLRMSAYQPLRCSGPDRHLPDRVGKQFLAATATLPHPCSR
jgi:hypothetical protein